MRMQLVFAMFTGLCMATFQHIVADDFIFVDFEELPLPEPSTYFNGAPNPGVNDFTSGGARFNNKYTVDTSVPPFVYEYWNGWAYSNTTDTASRAFENQYSALPGRDADGVVGGTYVVGFDEKNSGGGPEAVVPEIVLPQGYAPKTAWITNTTYTGETIRLGDLYGFTGPFEPGDQMQLHIFGLDAARNPLGEVIFTLADYTGGNEFILNTWQPVDLWPLAGSRTLRFELSSTDVGPFGINQPAYFALDNLQLIPVPEPGSLLLASVCGLILLVRLKRPSGR
jgi:hypothetical protein